MKTLFFALLLVAAFVPAAAQQRNHQAGHGGGGRPASHATGGQHGSFSGGQRRSMGHSGGYSHTAGSGGRHFGSSTGGHRSHMHGMVAGRVRGGGGFRPSGIGHPRDWFEHQRWHEGPAFRTPRFSCYEGFTWGYMPALRDLVWIFDAATGQYFQAYYYPDYGYYAWVSNPLVAIGEYSPQISIVVNL